jgi:hypothetical protein
MSQIGAILYIAWALLHIHAAFQVYKLGSPNGRMVQAGFTKALEPGLGCCGNGSGCLQLLTTHVLVNPFLTSVPTGFHTLSGRYLP